MFCFYFHLHDSCFEHENNCICQFSTKIKTFTLMNRRAIFAFITMNQRVIFSSITSCFENKMRIVTFDRVRHNFSINNLKNFQKTFRKNHWKFFDAKSWCFKRLISSSFMKFFAKTRENFSMRLRFVAKIELKHFHRRKKSRRSHDFDFRQFCKRIKWRRRQKNINKRINVTRK